MNLYQNNKKGMTMIEILIVLGIISILFATFFYIWNTLDIFRKSRDSKRINDLQAIDTALKTILATESNINLGQENIIYTSLQDSSSTCGSYNLTPLNAPFVYRCSATPTDISGNGWLPIDFTVGKVLTITVLPTDPLNNKDYFYAYQVKQGRYKLTARFESKNNIPKMTYDGGFEPTLYEVGSNLFIPSPHSGLVGYWSFDEATGTIAYDKSGYGNNGTLYSSTTPTDLHSTSSCKIGSCANFDGVDDYVNVPDNTSLRLETSMTVGVWINPSANVSDWVRIVGKGNSTYRNYGVWRQSDGDILWQIYSAGGAGNCWNDGGIGDPLNAPVGQWIHVVATYDGINMKVYSNGVLRKTCPYSQNPYTSSDPVTIGYAGFYTYFNGLIDEIKIYNRALSTEEIKALYEASK